MIRTSVIGCGNMGSVLLTGLQKTDDHSVVVCDPGSGALVAVADHCEETMDDVSRAADTDVVFVAVKPDIIEAVLSGLDLPPDQTLVTTAVGVPISFVEARTDARVVRIIPNFAAETRDMAAAATGDLTGEARELLLDVGEFVEVRESQMDIATVVNGSGLAFVFCLTETATQVGVAGGLSEEDAEILVAQTSKDAAETVVQDDHTADELIDAICSPNGTTIEGMEVLWNSDADDVVTEAVVAAEHRSKELAEEFADE